MKTIRKGNDIQISWTITRANEPEVFSGKEISVSLIDKFDQKQVFSYTIDNNVITGIFYGKDQNNNGVYRLLLTENAGSADMVTLDYIDCFCISNKLKNQTSIGTDSTSNINTEIVEVSSDITFNKQVQADWDQTDDTEIDYIKNKPIIPVVPENVSAFYNDAGYLTQHQDISGKADISSLSAVAFTGNYSDLSNKPSIPTTTSDLSNDSYYVSDSSYVHTDNNFTNSNVSKLDSIASGAEVNIINAITVGGVSQSISNKVVDLPAYPTTLPASDVYSWAKASTKPVYSYSEISGTPSIPTTTSDLSNDSGFVSSSTCAYIVSCTQDEYDNLQTYSSNTLYVIIPAAE